jgi:myo-inositol-1-phosphate synthase
MIKVGIIGMGYWGNILYKSLSKNKNYLITKVCGRKNNNYGDIFTTNYMDIIESDVDLIIISTQTKYHYENIIASINYGKNIFVEKPICLTATQSKSVIDLSVENKRKLFVDHIYTTNPFILKIKEIIKNDNSKLLKYKSFRFNEECKLYDTSIVENLMYHDFYILDLLFNNFDFYNIKPIINHIPFEYCDLQIGNINFVSSYRDKKTRKIEIETENNKIYWDEMSGILTINNEQIIVDTTIDNINHKFNNILYHIKNNTEDNSKNISLKILDYIEKYEL